MNQEQLKFEVGKAALSFVDDDMLLGVGTGSTVNAFIQALADSGMRLDAAVSSSEATTAELKKIGVRVVDLNSTGGIEVYIDGADEADEHRRLIKGGGGALTREKIIAASARQFVCLVDQSKRVDVLGKFPLPVEVVPMARSLVARKLIGLGGQPEYREGFVTDNGCHILDVHNLDILDPVRLESEINNLTGVISCGLFAMRRADVLLVASETGVTRL